MQDQYFDYIRKHLISPQNMQEIFYRLTNHYPIDKLKKLPLFIQLSQAVLPSLSINELCSKVAITAVQHNNVALIRYLIEDCRKVGLVDWVDNQGISLLLEAGTYGHIHMIRYLVQAGANVNHADSDGTILHRIAQRSDLTELLPELKRAGANLEIRNKAGMTPLHYAIGTRQLKSIVELKKLGANQNAIFLGMNCAELQQSVREGRTSVTVGKVQPVQQHYDAETAYTYGLIQPKRNQEIFQDIVKVLLPKIDKLDQHHLELLFNCYLFTSIGDITGLVKFFKLQLNKKTITPLTVFKLCISLSEFLVEANCVAPFRDLTVYAIDIFAAIKPQSNESFTCCNYLLTQSNRLACFDLSRRLAAAALTVPEEIVNPIERSNLWHNIGICHYQLSELKEARTAFQQAFRLNKDDADILRFYASLSMSQGFVDDALEACKTTSCQKYAALLYTQFSYSSGIITPQIALDNLPKDISDPDLLITIYDLQADCYYRLHDKQSALKKAIERFELTKKHYDSDNGGAFANCLRYFINCEQYQQGMEFYFKHFDNYKMFIQSNAILVGNIILLHMLNNRIEEAQKLLANTNSALFKNSDLAQLYIIMGLELVHVSKNYQAALQALKIAKQLDPLTADDTLILETLLQALMTQDLQTSVKLPETDLDEQLIKTVALDNQLYQEIPTSAAEQDTDADQLDPVKLHHFFQKKKNEAIINFTDSHAERSIKSIPQWQVGTEIFKQTDRSVVSLNSMFYPNYYATISPRLAMDAVMHQRFELALTKGICHRKTEQNGIKFINNCVIELKINDDLRLFTNTLYRNTNGHILVFFDQIGNHEVVKKLIRDRKNFQYVDGSVNVEKEKSGQSTSLFFAPAKPSPKVSSDSSAPVPRKTPSQ